MDFARGDRSRADRSRRLKPGTVLLREYQGERHTVTVVAEGYVWREATYASLSIIARAITATSWNGPRFFGRMRHPRRWRRRIQGACTPVARASGAVGATVLIAKWQGTITLPALPIRKKRVGGNLIVQEASPISAPSPSAYHPATLLKI